MAPLHPLANHLKRFHNTRRSGSASLSTLDLGATVGIAIAIAIVCSFALASFVYYAATRRKRSRLMRERRGNWADTMETGGYGTNAWAPRTGLGRVLSMFSPSARERERGRGRGLRSEQYRPPQYQHGDDSQHQRLPDKELENLRDSSAELEGGSLETKAALLRTKVSRSPGSFDDAQGEADINNAALAHPSSRRSERDAASDGAPSPIPAELPTAMVMPSNSGTNTDAAAAATPAAWHRKRTGPPPPLMIEPPGMRSQSTMDPYSAYSTYATSRSPYEYYAINVPSVPALPSQTRSDGSSARYSHHEEDPLHSSSSTRSSHPLQRPPSPQTPGSIPSMSRSDSGVQESQPIAPPTPTYSLPQSQPSAPRAAMIQATHFECLGPLPDHIAIPSPPHFWAQHQQQQQQQEDPFSTPRVLTPEDRSTVEQEKGGLKTTSTTGDALEVFMQDPLLHETNPFRRQPSPIHPTFDRAHSVQANRLQNRELSSTTTTSTARRRESTDSLGSNFTVEEEARIQEQIVRNLDALDKERVMDEMDFVHIPQVSERRYSWEE